MNTSKLSLKKIVNSFKNQIEERILSLDMLELTLRVIKTELGISSSAIPVFTVLNRDKPVLSPDRLVKAGLANELYSLCEQEQISPSVGIAPEFVLGRLALWLMLKEGVLDNKMLLAMLDEEREGWFRYNECIYYQYREQRILIGKATELFLIQYCFMLQSTSFKTKIYIKNINAFLVYKEILNEGRKLTHPTLKLAFRIETTFNNNPIFQQVSLNNLRHTLLEETTFLRVFSDKYLLREKVRTNNESITKRQFTAWSAIAVTKTTGWAKSKGSQAKTDDSTVNMNFTLITAALEPLTNNKIKKFKVGEYRNNLGIWLEDKDNAKRYPWVWLLKSWLFKLTFYGGSKKSKIRYNTVTDYVKTVSMPFLCEFIATDANLITLSE